MAVSTIDLVFRDYVTDGVPASGPHKPVKADIRDTLNDLLPNAARETLTANRTYYVRTDGSDSNDGLANTTGGAFLTIQKAVDVIYETIDAGGYAITIQVEDGTYTGAVALSGPPPLSGGSLTIIGDVTTPANCVISTTSADCFDISRATVAIRGFKLQTTTGGCCIDASSGSFVTAGAMEYGACAESHIQSGSGATISLSAAYTISGGAVSHWHCGSFGAIRGGSFAITLTGTPDFSAYFCGVAQGWVYVPSVTFSGSATGIRYIAHYGGGITAGGTDETFFPGDEAGNTAGFGAYIVNTVGASNVGMWVLQPEIYANNALAMQSKNFNANTWNTHIKMQNALTQGLGYFYMNGDDCYSSGRTHLAGDATVAVSSGTADGATYYAKSTMGTQPVFMMSNTGQAVGFMRRRTSDGTILGFNRDTTSVGSISVTTTNTAYNTSSDYRLKTDAKIMDGAIERLMKLRPVNFKWKVNGKRSDGFIAHEAAEVVPESVTGEKDATEPCGDATGQDGDIIEGIAKHETPDGYKWKKTGTRPVYQGIDQSKLVPLLTAALQAAIKRIDDLEKKVAKMAG